MTNPSPNERTSRRDFMKTSTDCRCRHRLVGRSMRSRRGRMPPAAIRFASVWSAAADAVPVRPIRPCRPRGTCSSWPWPTPSRTNCKAVCSHLKHEFSSQPERVAVEPDHQFTGFDAYEKVLAVERRPGHPGDAAGLPPDSFRGGRQGGQEHLHGEAAGRRRPGRPPRAGRQRACQGEELESRRRPAAASSDARTSKPSSASSRARSATSSPCASTGTTGACGSRGRRGSR